MKNILLLLFLSWSAMAQTQDTYNDPMPYGGSKGLFSDRVALSAGAIILLETTEAINADQLTVGKTLQFRVRTNVIAEREVAVRSGALAIGRVKTLESGTYNHPGELRIELTYVQAVDGQMVPLSGQEQSLKGQFNGQGAELTTGMPITAYVMNDVWVRVD